MSESAASEQEDVVQGDVVGHLQQTRSGPQSKVLSPQFKNMANPTSLLTQ